MAKLIAAFVIGLGLGACVVLFVVGSPVEPVSLPTASPPIDSSRITETPARSGGSQIKSLADIQSLPSEFERRAALYARLASADVNAVEHMLDEAESLTSPRRVKQVIYSRYVQLHPGAALGRLHREERDQRPLLGTTVSAAARLDLDAALAFIDTLDGALQTQSVKHVLDLEGLSDARKEGIAKRFGLGPYLRQLQASRQAKSDPAGAWQMALAIDGEERNRALSSIAYVWFETNPSASLSALTSLDDARWGAWQRELLGRWVAQDPDAALAWALAHPETGNRDSPLRQVAGTIAETSPLEMLELAGTLKPARRDDVIESAFLAWGRTDPAAALDTLMAMPDSSRVFQSVGWDMVDTWATDDPRSAFEWVRDQGPSRTRSAMLDTTLSNLGKSDPVRALALAEELDGVDRSIATEAVLRAWGRQDARAAAAWLDTSGNKTTNAVASVAGHYAELDPEGAFEWLQDQSDEAQRRAISLVVQRLAAESPESTLRMINRIRDSNAKQDAGSQLISTWAASDPQAAIRAIPRMDASMGQNLYQTAFSAWSRTDPDGATAFLDQVPSSNRDSAIQGVLQQTAFSNVDLAERLYNRLDDDGARRWAASILYMSLRVDDPKRAERYRELLGAEPQHITIYR